jgi:hypothetical protein
VDIDAGLDNMRPFISSGDWRGLEGAYETICRAADPRAASSISSIDLRRYTTALERSIIAAGEWLREPPAAVYWEFDVDSGWRSAFFRCDSYRPEADGDDDWASDFDEAEVIDGPAMPYLAAWLASAWRGSDVDVARNLYLIARTMAAFGRAAAAWSHAVPLCAGFHDQSVVFRVAGRSGGHDLLARR